MVSLGANILMKPSAPYIALGYYYGITDYLTVGGDLYPFFLFSSSMGADASLLFRAVEGHGLSPEISVGGGTYFYPYFGSGQGGSSFLPFARVAASSNLSKTTLAFVRVESLLANGNNIIFTPGVGIELHSQKSTTLQVEVKWLMFGGASINPQRSHSFYITPDPEQIGIFFGVFF